MNDTSREEFERLQASGELFEQFAAMRVQLAEQDEQFLLRVRERGEILRQLFIKESERESAVVALSALQREVEAVVKEIQAEAPSPIFNRSYVLVPPERMKEWAIRLSRFSGNIGASQ